MHIRPAQPRRNARLSVAISAACLAAASATSSCNEPTAPGAERELRDLISLATSADALGSYGNNATAPTFVPAFPSDPVCSYVAATQRFECPPITLQGLGFTRNRHYQLRDEDGQALDRWSARVTSIVNVNELSSSSTTNGATGTDEATLDGIGEATYTLTGSRTITYVTTPSFGGPVTTTVVRATSLTIPKATAVEAYPTGTISFTRTPEGAETITITMTFDGTSKVGVVRTVGAFTTTCTLDIKPGSFPICN
jgi:hypothetical protein